MSGYVFKKYVYKPIFFLCIDFYSFGKRCLIKSWTATVLKKSKIKLDDFLKQGREINLREFFLTTR